MRQCLAPPSSSRSPFWRLRRWAFSRVGGAARICPTSSNGLLAAAASEPSSLGSCSAATSIPPIRSSPCRRSCTESVRLDSSFPYWAFAGLIVLNGIGVGMFSAPNSASIMSSVPPVPRRRLGDALDLPEHRHRTVDRRVLLPPIAGMASSLPAQLLGGLQQQGVPPGSPIRSRPAAGLVAVRGGARREPGGASPRADRGVVFGVPRASAGTDGHVFLPPADRGRVPRRPRGRVQRRHRVVGARRRRLADARRPVRPHRRAPTHERIAR